MLLKISLKLLVIKLKFSGKNFNVMKIYNSKHLGSFSRTKTNVDKEGWLSKKGELNTSYQKRWCVLKGNLLFYFEKK